MTCMIRTILESSDFLWSTFPRGSCSKFRCFGGRIPLIRIKTRNESMDRIHTRTTDNDTFHSLVQIPRKNGKPSSHFHRNFLEFWNEMTKIIVSSKWTFHLDLVTVWQGTHRVFNLQDNLRPMQFLISPRELYHNKWFSVRTLVFMASDWGNLLRQCCYR